MEGEVRIGLPVKVEPAQIEIKPEARESGAESAARFAALVTDSAPLPGVRWWTLETRGHRGPANTVAYSPDGKWLVTGSDDGAIRIWDSAAGKLVRVLLGHSGAVRSVCWSPDGRYLASGGSGKTIQLWEPRAGLLLRTFTSPSEGHTVRAVAWSPDGKTLASCNGGTKPIAAIAVNLWDVVSGRILRSLEEHNEDVTAIVWSPDATRLASAGKDNRIRIWDPATGRLLRSIETNMVAALAWSPDGKTLASCLGLRHGEPIPGATLWDVDACEPRGTLMQTKLGTGAIAWSPAGTNLCCASPMDSSDVEVWSIGAGQFFYNAPVPFYNAGWASGNRACVWSPDGTRFAIAHGSGRTYVFRSTYGSRLYELPHHLGETRAVAFSPDGSHLASGHAPSTVDIWETGTGKPTGKRCKIGNRSTNCVSWSPDAQKVAFGTSPDQTVRILGVVSGRQHFMKASAIPNAAAWCSTGHRIACGGARAGVFDPASGERLLDLREYGDALAWSHDDRRIAVGGGNAVAICDSKTGQESQSFYCGFWPTRLAWSPDERLLAVSGWSTGIQVWNIEARRLVTTLETSIRGGIHFLRWDQDGRKLISGGETQTCVWDAADGKLLQTIPTGCRDLSPDGTLIAFPHPSMVRLSRFSDGHTVRTILGLEPDGYAVISPEGHWTGSGNAAEELVYVVQTEIGEQLTLTAAEFAARYGWKNDPSKVTPQPDAIRQQPASGAKSPGGAGQEKAKESGGPR
jgi:WD40 repeat protein